MSTRITNNITVRNYLSGMRSNLSNLASSNEKLTTQRSFNKASENVDSAARALRVRKLLNANERNTKSAEALSERLDTADSSLRAVSSVYDRMSDLITHGLNDTLSEQDRQILSNEVLSLRDEVLSIANSKYGDQYLFNSAGNAGNSTPFSVIGNSLYYNGNTTPIDQMYGIDGKVYFNDSGVDTEIGYNGKNYLDIGLGLSVSGEGASMQVDPRSVVESSLSGIEIFGYGTDSNGQPLNFYGLFTNIASSIASNNADAMSDELQALSSSHNALLVAIADVGSRASFTESITTQLESDRVSLQELQSSLEGVDLAEEIMYNSQYEMAWTVTLQLGSKILPKSIFDFL